MSALALQPGGAGDALAADVDQLTLQFMHWMIIAAFFHASGTILTWAAGAWRSYTERRRYGPDEGASL